MEALLAIGLIVLLCFLAGLFARTVGAKHRVRTGIRSAVQGSRLWISEAAGSSMMGLGEMAEHPVVLAQIEGAWRLGVQTDMAGSGVAAVFIPNSPNTFTGSVFF